MGNASPIAIRSPGPSTESRSRSPCHSTRVFRPVHRPADAPTAPLEPSRSARSRRYPFPDEGRRPNPAFKDADLDLICIHHTHKFHVRLFWKIWMETNLVANLLPAPPMQRKPSILHKDDEMRIAGRNNHSIDSGAIVEFDRMLLNLWHSHPGCDLKMSRPPLLRCCTHARPHRSQAL